MAPPTVSIEERIEQLLAFESEHGHLVVPQSYKKDGLGLFVKNARGLKKNGKLKPDVIEKLDAIGFMWTVPKGSAKEELIEWGKEFRWLVNFHKSKGHCNVPATIAGKPVPAAAWCDQQRQLHLAKKLDQGKFDKLSKLGFDFYGSCEEEPSRKRQRTDSKDADDIIKALRQEIKVLKEEILKLKARLGSSS